MKNVISHLFLLMLLLMMSKSYGQMSYHDHNVIYKNGVKELHTYEYKAENDSLLVATEKFNKFGRVTEIVSYNKSMGNTSCKIYYLKDTLIHIIEYYHQSNLTGIRRYKYNDIEREVSYVESRNNDAEINAYMEKYNENGHIIETKRHENGIIASWVKTTYFKNGKGWEVEVLEPKKLRKKLKYDDKGNLISPKKKNRNQSGKPYRTIQKHLHINGLIEYEYTINTDNTIKISKKHFYFY